MTTFSASTSLHSGRDPQTTLIRITEVMAIVGLRSSSLILVRLKKRPHGPMHKQLRGVM